MSNEHSGKPKQLNFNTVVNAIILATVGWIKVSITDFTKKQTEMSEDIAVMKATKPMQAEQLNRIETEQGRMRAQVNDIQREMQGIKPRL